MCCSNRSNKVTLLGKAEVHSRSYGTARLKQVRNKAVVRGMPPGVSGADTKAPLSGAA